MRLRGMEIMRRHQALLAGFAILVMVLLAYIPAMRGGFVWDDDQYVTENPLLTAPDGLKQIWFSLNSPSQYFPLVYTTLRVEHSLWGVNPFGYHLVNVLLHAANALLLWIVLRRLRIRGAWFAAAIFALHPVQVESVAWVTELKNVLSTLFCLLTVLAWMRFTEEGKRTPWRYYAASLVLCAFALFSKTTACTIPAVLLIVLWIRRQRITWQRVAQVMPFAVMGLLMGFLAIWWEQHHQGTRGAEFALAPMERILVASRALWFYVGKLVWPTKLAFSYPKWEINAHDPVQYLWLGACLAAVIVLLAYRKSWGRGPLIAAVFFGAVLSPMLGFISLYTFRYTYVADHYQYVASIGPIVLFAALVTRKWKRPQVRHVVPAAVLCALGILTWRQGFIYAGPEALWRDTLVKNPSSWMAHEGLGVVMAKQGSPDEAVAHYYKALEIRPDHWQVYVDLGLAYVELGEPDRAVEILKQGVEQCPSRPELHFSLANTLVGQGRLQEAATHYRTTVKMDPKFAEAYCNLALILLQQGKLDEAIKENRAAIRARPDFAGAYFNLAVLYFDQGRFAEAWEQVRLCRVHGLEPDPEFLAALSQEMPDPGK